MARGVDDPLFGPIATRTQLTNAPLVRVMAQVRFPPILKIATDQAFVADLQEDLRQYYPHVNREESQAVDVNVVGGGMQVNPRVEVAWRFLDASKYWRVSISTEFVSLETGLYTNRDDFMDRFEVVLSAVEERLRPAAPARVGYRYINRIVDRHNLERIDELVQSRLVGVSDKMLRQHVEHSMTEARCKTLEGGLLARWGLMPEGLTHDPASMPAADQVAWLLDIDSYDDTLEVKDVFNTKELRATAESLAARAYTFFMWSVRDEFLNAFGGQS